MRMFGTCGMSGGAGNESRGDAANHRRSGGVMTRQKRAPGFWAIRYKGIPLPTFSGTPHRYMYLSGEADLHLEVES